MQCQGNDGTVLSILINLNESNVQQKRHDDEEQLQESVGTERSGKESNGEETEARVVIMLITATKASKAASRTTPGAKLPWGPSLPCPWGNATLLSAVVLIQLSEL
ncbi:hypothetical protein CMEL01_06314 [Colletotrichum melonis]|uniref:Uncharacterized protein n=1 Tax=Colletotrichum melonis TaxID=1209925 RepID=A0AAI9U8H2_9PEZI|nr:hypothetical protein CMEL01_06314 [Colletotrichum melonis]